MTNEEIWLYKKSQNEGNNGSITDVVIAEPFYEEPTITVTIEEVTE